jgi:hypothetical protein
MSIHKTIRQTSPLPVGKTLPLLKVETPTTETWDVWFNLDSDSVLLSLFVDSLSSGALTVTAYAVAEEGKEAPIITFPSITAPTSSLLLKKAAVALGTVRVAVVTTGPVTLDLRARGISLGETTVRIEAAEDLIASKTIIGTSPSSIIPISLTDRNGLVFRNWGANTLYIAETALKANSSDGYPIGAGESLGIDVAAGQTIFGSTSVGTTDVRILEAGSI